MKKRNPKYRFRAAIRMVMQNKFWLTAVDEEVEITENVQQNVQRLKHRKKGYKQFFTLDEKSILNKAADLRTEEEKQHISKIIASLNCFRRYPEQVKQKLAGVCYYCYYPIGRKIVRENDPSQCMYFILSGMVSVLKTTYDELDEKYEDVQVGTLEEGSLFGEVALLHNIPRLATIVTLSNCEFLKMYKEDFDKVMKDTLQQKWSEIQAGMKDFRYFDSWNSMQVRECCIISRIKSFEPGNIVLGKNKHIQDSYVYFILSGQVRIMEELTMFEWLNKKGEKMFALYRMREHFADLKSREQSFNVSAEEILLKRRNLTSIFGSNKTLSTKSMYKTYDHIFLHNLKPPIDADLTSRFVQVCFLNKRGCFGLGELTTNTRLVVASKPTKCLLIPRYYLLKNTKLDEWKKIKTFLCRHIPTTDIVFKQFVTEQKWRKYKESLVQSLVNKPPPNTFSNIPYSIRLKEFYSN